MRWAVLGGSSRIFHKSLAPAMAAAGHEVVAAPSRDGESFQPYADALADPSIDAVYIPLPNHLHPEWIHHALDAGKHVLCEKPLTLTVAETEAAFDHAERAGKVLLEAYMWPHHPRARRLLELVRAGEIGSPQWGRAQFSWSMDMSSGDHRLDLRGAGALFDVGIYCLAPFMLMAGRDHAAVGANAVRNMAGVDLTMTGWVDWGGGFGSSFHVSFDAPPARSMALVGSDGVVTLPGWHAPGSLDPSDIVIERRDGSVEELRCDGADAYHGLVAHFADVVAGEATPVFGRTESVRLARAIEALHLASAH